MAWDTARVFERRRKPPSPRRCRTRQQDVEADLPAFAEASAGQAKTYFEQGIFPGRRLGRIADGAEASFLVLDGNPIDDFSAVTRIFLRVKQGTVLP